MGFSSLRVVEWLQRKEEESETSQGAGGIFLQAQLMEAWLGFPEEKLGWWG